MEEVKIKSKVEINQDQCKGCEICVMICPKGSLKIDRNVFNVNGFHPAKFAYHGENGNCNACGLCYFVCPDYAIKKIMKLKKGSKINEY